MEDDRQYLMISSLQHYAYCPRQFALIHNEQVWEENRFTVEGNLLHERVDSGVAEQRGPARSERGVWLESQYYQLKGKMDLLQIEEGEPPRYYPVEYKRGKPKVHDWDRVQLCAQALCLEEMRDIEIGQGALWYWQVRRREVVDIDIRLRELTVIIIEQAQELKASGMTPPPTDDQKRCRACSLNELCQPGTFRFDHSADYIEALFEP